MGINDNMTYVTSSVRWNCEMNCNKIGRGKNVSKVICTLPFVPTNLPSFMCPMLDKKPQKKIIKKLSLSMIRQCRGTRGSRRVMLAPRFSARSLGSSPMASVATSKIQKKYLLRRKSP